jgi:Transposase zinc-binding domain
MRPTLEVADVFRRHGAAFLDQHNAHLGRVERRVMAAIETCRTPALGGHVEQCNDCGLVRCAYNSCLMGKFSNGESAGGLAQKSRRFQAPWCCFVVSSCPHKYGPPRRYG